MEKIQKKRKQITNSYLNQRKNELVNIDSDCVKIERVHIAIQTEDNLHVCIS